MEEDVIMLGLRFYGLGFRARDKGYHVRVKGKGKGYNGWQT